MIDPHVHLRDWNEARKETLEHGLDVAYAAGLNAVFEMPNTNPSLISKELITERIRLADTTLKKSGLKIFHGLYGGITDNSRQIEEMVDAYNTFFPRVVGFKLYTSKTADLGITQESQQGTVYETLSKLGYKGVLAVHCEKESLFHPNLWDRNFPYTHALARPPEAETASVRDQIEFADKAGFKGTLHICHISVPESLDAIEQARGNVSFKITCGVTPHHCMLYDRLMDQKNGTLLKINPPLRPESMRKAMLEALLEGRIDWIESDHAPHTLDDKFKDSSSGIPVLPYLPHFIKYLRQNGASQKQIDNLSHNNIVRTFGIEIANTHRKPDYNLAEEYPFDPFERLK